MAFLARRINICWHDPRNKRPAPCFCASAVASLAISILISPLSMWRFAAMLLLWLALFPSAASADSVVVFNEIMYHPATNEPALEWVELYDQNSVDVDLSGWRLAGGIDFRFPSDTVMHGGGYLVVAISPESLRALNGLTNVLGPFSGRLSNSGEQVELRDSNDRLMDSVKYGVDGEWPVGPDGSGVSLVKRAPNLASKPAENWTASPQIGGTPGTANFTSAALTGAKTNLVAITATWRYNDTGTDLGTSWRAPGYDDRAWASGPALFFVEDAVLPAPKNTPLTPGRNTYYFRTSFDFNGDASRTLLSVRGLVDDGAVVYLNGLEVGRLNMPSGAVDYSTMASSAVANATLGEPFRLASSNLVTGQNLLAVELHQTTATVNPGLRIIPVTGYSVSWDGSEGDFGTPASPSLAPTNAALASLGVEAFTTSNTNLAANLNDGRYGSSSSWSPAPNDVAPLIILRFNQTLAISSIAWSRDNGNATEAACGGTCADRSLGNYTFQYTLATNPAVLVANSANPSNGWSTIATVQYLSVQPGFTPALRHRFDFASTNGNPILATGIRFRPGPSNTLDEIEINPPAVANFDAAFGLELTATDVLAPPPRLAFNELAAGTNAGFWLEVINYGDASVDLAGVQIVRSTSGSPGYTFGSQLLAPGGMVTLSQAQLGFSAADGQKISLYTPGRFALLDAVTVKARARGRNPDGSGDWLYPALSTPGASNVFRLHDELVINEVMYHHRPFDPVPAVVSNFTVIPINGRWRWNDSGMDLGTDWRAPAYDDRAWPAGLGVMSFHAGPLPAPTNTALAPGSTTYYFRASFDSSGATSNLTLNLRSIVDDGAVFYLNGAEIYRQNMPPGPIVYSTSASSPIGDADFAGPVTLVASNLVPGVNVLAVEVHQVTPATTSSGLTLSGGGLTLVEEGPFGGSAPTNLARLPGAAPFVIDSLAGYPIHDFSHLNDGTYGNANSWIGNSGSPGYAGIRFGGLFTISSFAFGRDNLGTFNDRTLGLYTLQYTRVAVPGTATTFTGNPDTGWATIGTLNYQGAGLGLFAHPSRRHRYAFDPVEATGLRLVVPGTGLASGTAIDELEVNPPDSTGDVAFGAELALATTLVPAVPFTKSNEEWVELYNRSTNRVDLTGWQIDGDIHFFFPAGTILTPDSYLVVANAAAALQAKWPEIAAKVVGDFSGRLGAGEMIALKDSLGNPVNTIRIFANGWSDGGGSSLELADPRADNRHAAAWVDSDESHRSAWQTVTYRMVAGQKFGSSFWNEFRLGLLDSGEVLVDDVSVLRDPDGARQQLIQNGDFEMTTGNTHWRMLGDHGHSQIIPDPDNGANHVLKVCASAPLRTSHNHIESSFVGNTPPVDGQEYEVSFRARWLAGSPQVQTCAYFAKLARSTALTLPSRHGTPGAVNSRRLANAGPAFVELKHTPVVPQTNQPVTISVRASDPDGVASATLNYRVNPGNTFTSILMALQADGTWTADIPGQAAGKIVHFYVSAQDSLGASACAPDKGPDARALYQVADAQGTPLPAHELRLIQLDADRDFLLNATNVMSQARTGGTVIYDRSEVFYDAGVRLHGSAAGRARDGEDYISYDIAFPATHLFRGVHDSVGIDRSGRAPVVRHQDEIYIMHLFHRAGIPCQYSDLCYFIAPKTSQTGTAILLLAAYGGLFVEEQYGVDGSVFNYDGTYEPSVTLNDNFESIKLPVPLQPQLWTDFVDLGNDQEQYRAPFDIRHGERRDDFSGIIRLCQTMASPQPQFDAQISTALDVPEALRLTALTVLCGIGDIYFSPVANLPHNVRIFTPVAGGPAHFLPWDMDFVFLAAPTSSIFPAPSSNLYKLINNPDTLRLYLGEVNDLCQVAFNTAYVNPWLAHYGSVVGQNYSAGSSYIQSRRSFALRQLPAPLPFAISNNGGRDFLTNTPTVRITGSGWLDIRAIQLAGSASPLAVTWITPTNWSATVPLMFGTNLLTFVAYDRATNVLATQSITVTTTSTGGGTDTDGDGMPDWWELANGLNAAANDANGDLDGDGVNNLQEFLSGTDPKDAQSFLAIQAAGDVGLIRLSFLAAAGRSYSVLSRDDVTAASWLKVAEVAARATNGLVVLSLPQPASTPRRFFRLVTPQQP